MTDTDVAMRSVLAVAPRRADVLDCWRLRCWSRAYLWRLGMLDLHEAVDVLQFDAERDGLVAGIGQDTVQEIIAAAFQGVRDD